MSNWCVKFKHGIPHHNYYINVQWFNNPCIAVILLLSLPNVIFFLLKLSATVLQDLQFLWLLEYKSRILFKKNKTFQLNIVILCLAFTFIILMNVIAPSLKYIYRTYEWLECGCGLGDEQQLPPSNKSQWQSPLPSDSKSKRLENKQTKTPPPPQTTDNLNICVKTFICLIFLNQSPFIPTANKTMKLWYNGHTSSKKIKIYSVYKCKSSNHQYSLNYVETSQDNCSSSQSESCLQPFLFSKKYIQKSRDSNILSVERLNMIKNKVKSKGQMSGGSQPFTKASEQCQINIDAAVERPRVEPQRVLRHEGSRAPSKLWRQQQTSVPLTDAWGREST